MTDHLINLIKKVKKISYLNKKIKMNINVNVNFYVKININININMNKGNIMTVNNKMIK
jgi:hypothetical protein